MVDFKQPGEQEEPKPAGSSTEINMGLPAILQESGGSLERAIEAHAFAWYTLAFGLQSTPPKFPPNPGIILPGSAKIVEKVYFYLARIFNAYEEMVKTAREALAALETKYNTDTASLISQYDARLASTEQERQNAVFALTGEKRLVRDLEKERDGFKTERDTAQSTLTARVRDLDAAIKAKEKFENDLKAKAQELVDAETAKKQVDGELATVRTAKQQADAALVTRVRELAASKTAKETAERNFADLKPQFEKVSREYAELMKKFSHAMSEGTALAQENISLYTQIEEFIRNAEGLTAALTVEQKRAEDLEIKLREAERKLSKSQLRVRTGWYAAAATALIGLVGYVGWAITERPVIVQPPIVKVEPKVEKPETMSYLMGAFLYELPDGQLVVSAKRNADLEGRAKSARYLTGAYLVDFEDKKFALTDDRKSAVAQQIGAEKAKLGRDLNVAERKAVYDKAAFKFSP